jgi:bacterioferritin (cytochrome b1)
MTCGSEVVAEEMTAEAASRGILLLTMNFYRDAELQGARLLLNLHRHLRDPDSQLKLTRHLADEARHAWLWTERICDLGGAPTAVASGYQRRMGRKIGIPANVTELLALTLVAENRAIERYRAHAARPDVDAATLAVLNAVTRDEDWHLKWIETKLREFASTRGGSEHVQELLERYGAIDREVYASLEAYESFLAEKLKGVPL